MTDQIDYPILDRIAADWFQPNLDVIGIVHESENTVQGNRFLFGCEAGPTADLFNLTHEMSHFIEIDVRRCHLPGWGLKYGKSHYMFGKSWYEMSSTQAVKREIRTLGIQLVLNRHYQIPDQPHHSEKRDSEYMAKLTTWVQNWECYGYVDGKFVSDYEPRAMERIEAAILAEMRSWSLQSIRIAWKLRLYHLRQKQRRGVLKTREHDYHREVKVYV